MSVKPEEHSNVWINQILPDVMLMKAAYKTFSFEKHWHDELAIGFTVDGIEGIECNGQNALVGPGQICAVNAGDVHTGFAKDKETWAYREFYIPPQLLEDFMDTLWEDKRPTAYIRSLVIDDPALLNIMIELHRVLETKEFALTAQTYFHFMITQLIDKYIDCKPFLQNTPLDSSKTKLIKDYIHDHWDQDIGLDHLSNMSGLNKFQLLRQFKRAFGITPHKYALQLKLNKAREFIQDGYALADVACLAGFFDQSHMHRNFKRVFGVRPGQLAII